MAAQVPRKAPELLPHNIKAEEVLIGALLIGGQEFIPEVQQIKPGDFYRERNGIIWGAILTLASRGQDIDRVTVEDELIVSGQDKPFGGTLIKYLHDCMYQCPTPFHAKGYARLVKEFSRQRHAITEAGRKAGEAWEGRVERDFNYDEE